MFELDTRNYKILVIGFALLFMVAIPLPAISMSSQDCGVTTFGDSLDIQKWRHSCQQWNYNMTVILPSICEFLGILILVLGFGRLYLDKKKTNQNKTWRSYK